MDLVRKNFDPMLETKSGSNMLIIVGLLLVSIPIIGVGLATTRTIIPYDWKQIVPTLQAIPLAPDSSSPFVAPTTALFTCSKGKSVAAAFGASAVELTLSDGRRITLPQSSSASGARYTNPDESFVFWNKGDTAFVEEAGTTTYSDCVTKN